MIDRLLILGMLSQGEIWESFNTLTGKVCGHKHTQEARAQVCACKLGEAWRVRKIEERNIEALITKGLQAIEHMKQ